MFRITRDPSSGSCIPCLAKITVMVLYCPLIWTVPLYTAQYTHTQCLSRLRSSHTHQEQICCHNTRPNRHLIRPPSKANSGGRTEPKDDESHLAYYAPTTLTHVQRLSAYVTPVTTFQHPFLLYIL